MSTMHTTAIAAMLLTAAGSVGAQAPSLPPPVDNTAAILQDIVATQAFEERVTQYANLHRLLEGPLPPLRVTTNVAANRAPVKALALRIQRVRANAGPGDIITADVARLFRRSIRRALPPEQWAAVFEELATDEEGTPVAHAVLRVNSEWPAHVPFDFVPPQLLRMLPPLPVELQYRIVGRSLVLWDHHANLIVDFLAGAFVSGT
jgi:hypothetical protein